MVVSAEEWAKKTKPKESLAEFLSNSPLRGSGLETGWIAGCAKSCRHGLKGECRR